MFTSPIQYTVRDTASFFEIHYRYHQDHTLCCVFVLDGGDRLVGIVGTTQMLDAMKRRNKEQLCAQDIMNTSFISVTDSSNTYAECLTIFRNNDFNNIPIISDASMLLSIAERKDFTEIKILSLAQNCEDVILHHILHGVDKLFWIDVGAYDPWNNSVTKWFSLSGRGNGINVEPQEKFYNNLVRDRPNEINLKTCIGDYEGEINLYQFGELTTAIEEYADSRTEAVISSPIETLTEICHRHASGKEIHFLKIDVEGFEKQVLLGMDFQKYHPWVIMIEATIPNTGIPIHESWEDILINNRYLFANQYGINRIYIATERSELLDRCIDHASIIKRYNVFKRSQVIL